MHYGVNLKAKKGYDFLVVLETLVRYIIYIFSRQKI